uniref:Uncharacterized protein n=1 Tax=Romanomermis culicivorax TaxID=13658 RepID=A0A915JKL8_ROMCU
MYIRVTEPQGLEGGQATFFAPGVKTEKMYSWRKAPRKFTLLTFFVQKLTFFSIFPTKNYPAEDRTISTFSPASLCQALSGKFA